MGSVGNALITEGLANPPQTEEALTLKMGLCPLPVRATLIFPCPKHMKALSPSVLSFSQAVFNTR